jgi:hypothetical protein
MLTRWGGASLLGATASAALAAHTPGAALVCGAPRAVYGASSTHPLAPAGVCALIVGLGLGLGLGLALAPRALAYAAARLRERNAATVGHGLVFTTSSAVSHARRAVATP